MFTYEFSVVRKQQQTKNLSHVVNNLRNLLPLICTQIADITRENSSPTTTTHPLTLANITISAATPPPPPSPRSNLLPAAICWQWCYIFFHPHDTFGKLLLLLMVVHPPPLPWHFQQAAAAASGGTSSSTSMTLSASCYCCQWWYILLHFHPTFGKLLLLLVVVHPPTPMPHLALQWQAAATTTDATSDKLLPLLVEVQLPPLPCHIWHYSGKQLLLLVMVHPLPPPCLIWQTAATASTVVVVHVSSSTQCHIHVRLTPTWMFQGLCVYVLM